MVSNHKDHLFWKSLPPERQSRRAQLSLNSRRLLAWLRGKQQRIAMVLIVYLVIWSLPWIFGQPLITFLALMPVFLVPPVGYLIYRLVWKEFHE